MASSRISKVFSLSLAQAIMTLMSVVSGMIFARYLSVSDYATYLQTFLAYDFCVPILTLGLPSALYYFLPGEKRNEKGIVIDNLSLLFLSALIFSLFLFIGGSDIVAQRFDNPNLRNTLRWMIAYPLYTFPIVIGAVLVIKDKVKINAVYNVVTGIILTGTIILTALLSRSYELPTLIRIYLPLLFFPVSLFLTFKYLSGEWRLPMLTSMWRILKFSIPLGFASVCGTITLQLSNLVVSLYCSPEEYAIFATGAREIPVIGIVTGSIAVVTMAEMSENCKRGNFELALLKFRDAAIGSAMFLFPIFVYLLFYSEDFIQLMYTNKYIDSLFPFRICLLLLPFRIMIWGSAFIALGHSKKVLYRSVIELLFTIVLCYIFVHQYGFWGAALAPVVVNYFWALPYNLISLSKLLYCKPYKLLPLSILSKIFVLSIFAGIISSIFLFLEMSSIYRLLYSLSLFILSYLVLFFRQNKEFKNIILSIVKK